MTDVCDRLAGFVLAPGPKRRDPRTIERAKVLLVDTLGCMVAGRLHSVARKFAMAKTDAGAARSLATGASCTRLSAILQTGTAIRALDFNDFFWGPGMGGHPSDVFATALVLGDQVGSALGDVLDAVVVGYDVYIGLLDLMSANNPFDHTTAGALASTAIAGRLLGMQQEVLAEAMAMVVARGPALSMLRKGAISEVKAASAALACMDGVLAAEMALAGLTGPRAAVSDRHGLPAILRDGASLDQIVPDRAAPAAIHRSQIKRFPCIGTAQAAAAAAIELHRRLVPGCDIVSVTGRIADNPVARHQTGEAYRFPQTVETADHSFFAVISMGLTDGAVGLHSFRDQRWRTPQAMKVAGVLTLESDLPGATEGVFPCDLSVELTDGTRHTAHIKTSLGHPLDPLTLEGALVKFRECADGAIPKDAADRMGNLLQDCRPGAPICQILDPLCSAFLQETMT